MKLELEILGSFCDTKVFSINDIEASWQDFGDKYDTDRDSAEDYGCGNMEFIPKLPTQEILEKYQINNSEYLEVQEKLGGLSFGNCGWCI
jgi:hypothetical protein